MIKVLSALFIFAWFASVFLYKCKRIDAFETPAILLTFGAVLIGLVSCVAILFR